MAHPSRMSGNSALALVSVNGEDNDRFAGPMMETPHLQQCPYIRQIMGHFDEVIARSRLMQLAPGAEVSPHVDFNYHWYNRVRIHIPIVTQPEVTFYCGEDSVHMQPGECWIFDSWRRHRVTNQSSETRIHLVIDTAGSGKFWQRVRRMEQLENKDVQTELVPFQIGQSTEIRTEKYNVSPVMAPGEMEAMIDELILDFSENRNNSNDLIDRYTDILRSLAKDWRAIWLEYGWEYSALPKYEALLSQTVRQFHPEKRALVSNSNDVGINPIIMQRIVRAALFREELPRFTNQIDN